MIYIFYEIFISSFANLRVINNYIYKTSVVFSSYYLILYRSERVIIT